MRIAVVGPRQGADLEAVARFMRDLKVESVRTAEEYIIVSGGAEGVDQTAEQTWLSLGGRVNSYRIRKLSQDEYGIDKWILGDNPQVIRLLDHPTFLTPASALYYRSMVVAEVADKVCAFEGVSRMRGTEFTVFVSKEGERKPTYVWRDGEWASYNT